MALKHEKIRAQVAYMLGQIGPPAAPAADALAKLISDKNSRVAAEAAVAIAKIGPGAKSAVPALIAKLQQGDEAAPSGWSTPWARSGRTPLPPILCCWRS